MLEVRTARPPYIEFYREAVMDGPASEAAGRRVTKDVNMVRIIPPGGQLTVEKRPEDWIAQLRRKIIDNAHDAFPEEWIRNIEASYEAWKNGLDAPLNGTPVKEWPILSPAQVQNFISARIMTVEDVAAMTEEAMGNIGMGARDLREKAREWLQGKKVAELAMAENDELKKELAALREELAAMKAEQVEPYPKKRGRPAKVAIAA